MNQNNIPSFKFVLREDLKDDKQFLPNRAESQATGWDVRAAQEDRKPICLRPFEKALIPLGVRAFCPEGWWFELKPRSSTFAKKHLHCLYGTIDQNYHGQIFMSVQYIPPGSYTEDGWIKEESPSFNSNNYLQINFGEAIAQVVPVRRNDMVVEEVSTDEYESLCSERNGERGAGGFGSTDNKR